MGRGSKGRRENAASRHESHFPAPLIVPFNAHPFHGGGKSEQLKSRPGFRSDCLAQSRYWARPVPANRQQFINYCKIRILSIINSPTRRRDVLAYLHACHLIFEKMRSLVRLGVWLRESNKGLVRTASKNPSIILKEKEREIPLL